MLAFLQNDQTDGQPWRKLPVTFRNCVTKSSKVSWSLSNCTYPFSFLREKLVKTPLFFADNLHVQSSMLKICIQNSHNFLFLSLQTENMYEYFKFSHPNVSLSLERERETISVYNLQIPAEFVEVENLYSDFSNSALPSKVKNLCLNSQVLLCPFWGKPIRYKITKNHSMNSLRLVTPTQNKK